MHLQAKDHGFYGSVPIVAGTIPLAVGAGLAAKMDGNKCVSLCYFGDGAVEEGVAQESLNLAKTLQVPVIFVVENNLFASHMHLSQRQPHNSTCRFADANSIDYQLVDGNDFGELFDAFSIAVEYARQTCRPRFIEAVTYRWLGHVDWRDDIDVGVSRSADDIEAWKKHDPIQRYFEALRSIDLIDEVGFEKIKREIVSDVSTAWALACKEEFPKPNATLDFVYAK